MATTTTSIPDLHTATAMAGGRPYDLVVVGASGFVGKLMTQHLLRKYALGAGHGFRLVLSARNKERLARVHGELAREEQDPEAAARALAEVPVLWGDVDSPDFAESVAKQARVVAASLTPYSKHGSKLVAACVEQGTSYVDISGEMLWLRESVERHHRPAEHKGIKIVHACGLGSVPADLSAMLMLRHLEEDKVTPTEIKFLMGPVYSSLGGGSMQSYATLIATAKTEGKIRAMLDPHFLAAPALGDVSRHHQHHEEKEEEEAGAAKHELAPVLQVAPKVFGIGFDWDLRRFTAPLWLAALDGEVVARSAALLGYPKGLRYVEAQTYSPTLFGLASVWLTFLAAYAFAGLLYLAPTRWLLTHLRPSGSGPNRYIRERGHGVAFLVAKGTTRGKGQVTYTGEFTMPAGDPGYTETAKMAVESALCLVLEEGRLPKRAGVLTPASAFGEVLMERLNKAANMEFKM